MTFVATPTIDCPAIMFGPAEDQTVEAGQEGMISFICNKVLRESVTRMESAFLMTARSQVFSVLVVEGFFLLKSQSA